MTLQFQTKLCKNIIFGVDSWLKILQNINNFGEKALFLLSPSFAKSFHWQDTQTHETGIRFALSETISGEPSPEMVDGIVARWKDRNINVVVACGGGSVLDTGKAVAAMLCEEDSVKHFLEGIGDKIPSGKTLPFIAVPTTSGTGSEVTCNAVLSEVGEGGFKKSLRHDNYMPAVALVDPRLTLTCSRNVTINCAMDALSQLVEGYLSKGSNNISDAMALEGIIAMASALEEVVENGKNIEARSKIAYASMLSGMVLTNAGLGTVHGFASSIGGLFNIPHGVVCGTLMAHANRLTLRRLRREKSTAPNALHKYAKLGLIFGSEASTEEEQQDFFISELIRLSSIFAIPALSDYGVNQNDIDRIISLTSNKNNPVHLSYEEMAEVLSSRI